jgi:hypothetical protein
MSEDKPKYVRKKCEHNKYSFQCKECKGASICQHDKQKYYCKECNNNKKYNSIKCEHDKRKSRCVECGGGSICEHKKVKSRCIECNGSEICEHKKRKTRCIECKGSEMCEHKKRKSLCVDCCGSGICEHKKDKHTCIECHGNNICEHDKLRYQCVECEGNRICEHKKRRCICKECDGIYLCPHKEVKNKCIICRPEIACQHCRSVSIIASRWAPYCFRCYCVLNPDVDIPKKFKLREHFVRDTLKEHYGDSLTMTFDKTIEGGCSRRRPDIFIDFGSHCLIIEIDENRHINYICEQKRMVEIYEDLGFRKVVFIRFNPDGYSLGSEKYTSPFSYTKTGIINVNKKEMKRRITELIQNIDKLKISTPENDFMVNCLFYGDLAHTEIDLF